MMFPDNHDLIYSLKQNGISKKEAAKIQPSYSCHATIGSIRAGDPLVEFLGIVLSIAGLATILSFCWGLNHVLYNTNKRNIMVVILVGIAVTGGGFGTVYQNSIAEPFTEASFSGTYGTINIVDDVSTYYWIDGGKIENTYNGRHFEIIPDGDGQLVIAFPPIITKGYYNYYHDDYFVDAFILIDGQEIEPPAQYNMNGYAVLTVPFTEDDSSVEIIGAGLCSEFIFD